jgi:hypothetical protein
MIPLNRRKALPFLPATHHFPRRSTMLLFIPRSLCALKRVAAKAEHSRYGAIQGIFYYGDGYPLGFCAQNPENGMMIDALVVPLSLPQEPEKPGEQNGQAEPSEGEQAGPRSCG